MSDKVRFYEPGPWGDWIVGLTMLKTVSGVEICVGPTACDRKKDPEALLTLWVGEENVHVPLTRYEAQALVDELSRRLKEAS